MLRAGARLPDGEYRALCRRLALDGCKWDLQLGDHETIARFPLVIDGAAFRELSALAVSLAAELDAALAELLVRRELFARLAIPRRIRRWLAPPFSLGPRMLRFDFHLTTEGWRISEVNADVPGGYAEASLLPKLFGKPAGDPSARWSDAIARAAQGRVVALLRAPRFLEDHQVLSWLERELARRGVETHACTAIDRFSRYGAIVRFYQAEWLRERGFFSRESVPIANPGSAILVESKAFPLVWDELRTPLPTWRRLLPETRERAGDGEWVWKAPFCNTGDQVQFQRRRGFVAQRRFRDQPIQTPDGPRAVCLGVYVLEGEAVGIYGRLARGAIVDWSAQDVAVILG
jgi:hypothetical protein